MKVNVTRKVKQEKFKKPTKLGRPKKSYNPGRKGFYCGDIEAWEICLKRKINLSEELTQHIRFLAYGNIPNVNVGICILQNRMRSLELNEDKEILAIQQHFKSKRIASAIELSRLQELKKKAKQKLK